MSANEPTTCSCGAAVDWAVISSDLRFACRDCLSKVTAEVKATKPITMGLEPRSDWARDMLEQMRALVPPRR